jgi:hypothetical protein
LPLKIGTGVAENKDSAGLIVHMELDGAITQQPTPVLPLLIAARMTTVLETVNGMDPQLK